MECQRIMTSVKRRAAETQELPSHIRTISIQNAVGEVAFQKRNEENKLLF